MAANIFVNLPVADLESSKAFFGKLGYSFNAQFTDETATCMVVSDTIFFMLLTHPKFSQFTPLPIGDAKLSTQALYAMSRDSKAEVDTTLATALAAGGTEPRPVEDHGFMYSRAFADPDGHIFEIFWMDPSVIEPTE
ncbi:VOC family protein [Devosia sp. 2618]|uniref:VOC family protein n=1 Tax=Devosia sp. 2618 TaxID=3156454 RepID=UPI00339AA694